MSRHPMKPAVLVVLLAMLASSPLAATLSGKAVAANCSLWNTWEFFDHATPSDVSECLKLGADPNATDSKRLRRNALAHRGAMRRPIRKS